jgi:sporulation protein YlmC with PRC-barrel domain
MRLSELLDMDVVDENGTRAGHVHDVRLVQDGPVGAGFDTALRVQGLVIGRGAVGIRLGYGRTLNRGPWLIRVLLSARHDSKFVPWGRVRSIDDDGIVIAGSAADLEPAPVLPAWGAPS